MSSHRDLHLLRDASDTRIFSVIDEVLRSGSHAIDPPAAPPEPNAAEEWWFELNGETTGPLDVSSARALWEDGVPTPDTPCWREGFSSWLHLSQVEELAEQFVPRREVRPPIDAAASFLRRVERRRRLPEPPPAPEWEPDIVVEEPVTLAAIAPAFVAAPPPQPVPAPDPPVVYRAPPRRDLRHAVVTGLVAGSIIAVALAGIRTFWPLPAPPEPIVVYVRDDGPAKNAPAKRKRVAKKKQQKKKPAAAARPTKQKRSKVDEQFDRVFSGGRR